MKVQLTLRIDLKDRPQGYTGLTSETYVIGKEIPTNFTDAAISFILAIGDYYGLIYELDELEDQRKKLAAWIEQHPFHEEMANR